MPMYRCATFSLEKLPQTDRMLQMSSASVFLHSSFFCYMFECEDYRRHYQEIESPGPQRVKGITKQYGNQLNFENGIFLLDINLTISFLKM